MQGGLTALDGEVVVGFTAHDIRGELALCEEGVGGDLRAPNVAAVEERDEHSGLIGLPGFFLAFYGQCADFFRV